MLHALKRKAIGGMHARHEPRDVNFDNARQKLDNVQKALTNALDAIEKSEKSWTAVVDDAQEFCEGLHSLYPQDDEIRALFKKTLDEATNLENAVKSDPEASSNIKSIERMVRGYLAEIKNLKNEYPKVEDARRDYAMYHRKAGRLEARDAGDERKSRVLDLMQSSKATYDSILEGITHRMNSTYDKSPTMFKAAFVAYWLSQRRTHGAVTQYFQPAISFSSDNETSLFSMTQTALVKSESK